MPTPAQARRRASESNTRTRTRSNTRTRTHTHRRGDAHPRAGLQSCKRGKHCCTGSGQGRRSKLSVRQYKQPYGRRHGTRQRPRALPAAITGTSAGQPLGSSTSLATKAARPVAVGREHAALKALDHVRRRQVVGHLWRLRCNQTQHQHSREDWASILHEVTPWLRWPSPPGLSSSTMSGERIASA